MPVISVKVAWSARADEAKEVTVELPAGATLLDALRAGGVLQGHRGIDPARQAVGIWGQLRPLDTVLRAGDRVEVYRPLQVDPKEARRLRQRQQTEATCNRRR
ncbi:MAG TPA: RnfH family protein [Caldimonas sp.]